MKFLEKDHVYINDFGDKYLSCTQLIKLYTQPKDWDEILLKTAKKRKKTPEQLRQEWDEENAKAIAKGLAFHSKKEQEFICKPSLEYDGELLNVYPNITTDGVKIARELRLKSGFYPELLIFSHRYMIAGQADLVVIKDNVINIDDYKTSKEIKKESYEDWKNGYDMMLFPLNNLMDSNYWHYSLQLNLYMLMLRSHNPHLKIGKMRILHILDEVDDKNENIVKVYEVPNLQDDATRLLEHYTMTSNGN